MKKTLPQWISIHKHSTLAINLTNELIISVYDEQNSCLCRAGTYTQGLMNLKYLLNIHCMCTEYIAYKIGKEWMKMVTLFIELIINYVLIIKYYENIFWVLQEIFRAKFTTKHKLRGSVSWAVLSDQFLCKIQQSDLFSSWWHPVWVYVTMAMWTWIEG